MPTGMQRRRCPHKYWDSYTHRRPWFRLCRYCSKKQYNYDGTWKWEMTLNQFGDKWLPAISGTKPVDMMHIRVAFPFEFNSYESWDIVYKVKFNFHDVSDRNDKGLGTLTDVMNGWQSKYHVSFNGIDHEASEYYKSVRGREYQIGDNTYSEMRAIIQR